MPLRRSGRCVALRYKVLVDVRGLNHNAVVDLLMLLLCLSGVTVVAAVPLIVLPTMQLHILIASYAVIVGIRLIQ